MAKELQRKAREAAAPAQDLVDAGQAAAQTAGGAQESHFWTHLGWLLLGTGLGALTTYMLDPDRGRRRQALVRDRVVHARTVVRREVPKRVRHVQNRLQGVQHELGLRNGDASGAAGDTPESPEWEIQHNDNGSLTAPGY